MNPLYIDWINEWALSRKTSKREHSGKVLPELSLCECTFRVKCLWEIGTPPRHRFEPIKLAHLALVKPVGPANLIGRLASQHGLGCPTGELVKPAGFGSNLAGFKNTANYYLL